mmetsp:Transcript_27636/g.61718  ORF Transcript_27636/g.61718 Transcript_27636/m.61718 type:complete len:247 (+) Transcript_27636:305-1045(+)
MERDRRVEVVLSVVVHVPEVEAHESGCERCSRVGLAVFVVGLAIQVVGDVEERVHRLPDEHGKQPVFGQLAPGTRRAHGAKKEGVERQLQSARTCQAIAHMRRFRRGDRVEPGVAHDVPTCPGKQDRNPGAPNTKAELAPADAQHLLRIRFGVARHGVPTRHDLRVPLWIVGPRVVVLVKHPLPAGVREPGQRDRPRHQLVQPAASESRVVDALVLSAVTHGDETETHQRGAESSRSSAHDSARRL